MDKKKFVIMVLFAFMCLNATYALTVPSSDNQILNENDQQVLNTQGITDPIRDGAYKIVNANDGTTSGQLGGIIGTNQIVNHQTAQNQTIGVIKNIINYALGLVALIALIYLMYHGVLILTAAGDDTQYKKGLKGIKYAAIAMGGIGLSWLFVSFIFRVINLITGP